MVTALREWAIAASVSGSESAAAILPRPKACAIFQSEFLNSRNEIVTVAYDCGTSQDLRRCVREHRGRRVKREPASLSIEAARYFMKIAAPAAQLQLEVVGWIIPGKGVSQCYASPRCRRNLGRLDSSISLEPSV